MRAPRSEARQSAIREREQRRIARRIYGNNNDASIPELWAKYVVALLEKYMVAGKLVHRDFEPMVQEFGDVINTKQPSVPTIDRKDDTDTIVPADVSLTNIQVTLNMQPFCAFGLTSREMSLSMDDLVNLHLDSHIKKMAEFIDASVYGQYAQFLSTSVGGDLGSLSSTNYQAYLTELTEALDVANCPTGGRTMLISPHTKALILQNQTLVGADQRGKLTALEQGEVGDIYGIRHIMSQTARTVSAADVFEAAFLINNAGGYQAGDSVLTVDTGVGAVVSGMWIKLLGKPYRITAHVETLGATTQITISPVLREAVPNNDPFTIYDFFEVDNGAGYPAGHAKSITYNGATILPKVGQGITFENVATIYTIVQVTATKIWLDRALEAAIADNDNINVLPPGEYGFCFVRDAVTLVCRNLEAPMAGTNGIAITLMHAGYPLRIVISYDWATQKHIVVMTLDVNKGGVLLG
jgi:hypothetical protein